MPLRVARHRWLSGPHDASQFSINMMAALNTQELPAMTLKQFRKFLAGYGLHILISSTWSSLVCLTGRTSIDKHPSIAS